MNNRLICARPGSLEIMTFDIKFHVSPDCACSRVVCSMTHNNVNELAVIC